MAGSIYDRRNGHDQNNEDPGMPPRGSCSPAAIWQYANDSNGNGTEEVTPDSVANFVSAAVAALASKSASGSSR